MATFANFDFLVKLGIQAENLGVYHTEWTGNGPLMPSFNPVTGELVAHTKCATVEDYQKCVETMNAAHETWMLMSAPARGEIVRQIGEEFRKYKTELGQVVSLEMGKIISEGCGEIQEIVDICDLAVGLCRQLEGKVIQSERPMHTVLEQWMPLGNVGVITAFNFPAAVLGWNLALSMITGNCTMWKGAETTPLVSLAVTRVIANVLERNNLPRGIFTLCQGDRTVGEAMVADKNMHLISFTGSTQVGRVIAQKLAGRFAKQILELGGNNASIIMEDADIDLAVRASVFGAVGTCGQRCTSLRRLMIHESVYETVKERLLAAYKNVRIGNPLENGTLCGPLHSEASVKRFEWGVEQCKQQGGKILCGGKRIAGPGFFVEPTINEISHDAPIVQEEVFAPILHLIKISSFEEGVRLNNSVPQGLSSSIYTKDMQKVFKFIGPRGSDCGLANVNMGTSGAEIGGAFGGEKETGGGRESGSDSWKQYCRRITSAINFGNALPLAQGVVFE